jgi:hypothetical protein
MMVHEIGIYSSIIPYIYRNKLCVFTLNNAADISWQSGCVASSTTKTGPHDIAEILLKVALNTKNQSINQVM